ncbi:DUF3048 domain-containing protein [Mangrovibacillus cuniculi]|nr:DUF3048 domain-containing protein [Mangrovibacillus cuniculi]
MSYLRSMIGAGLSIWLLTACSKEEAVKPVSVPAEEVVDNKEETEDGKEVEAGFEAPLSGELLEEETTQRAVAVTINNHPKARPQSGLAEADIVLEMLAEGSVTRLLAIYQSEQPEKIGPVRSSRDYFIDLANGYDAFYVSHGYSPDAKSKLDAGEIDHINGMQYDGSLFNRSSERRAPHNSYITWANIEKGAEMVSASMDTPPSANDFVKELQVGNSSDSIAKEFTVSYYNDASFTSTYTYDEGTNAFHRSIKGEQTKNNEDERPVELRNIVIMEAKHKIVDDVGRRTIDLESGGNALLFQQGTVQEIEWQNEDGRLVPYSNGEPIKLLPGKTWIHLVPELSFASY